MARSCNALTLFSCILLAFPAAETRADSGVSAEVGVCVAVAKEGLALFGLDDKTLQSRCECVKDRRNGHLPRAKAEWDRPDERSRSARVNLIECSQSDIISFYSGVVFSDERSRLERSGRGDQELEIRKAEDFSACVGEGAYNEVLRVVTSGSNQAAKLDRPKFIEMYVACERAPN